MRVFDCTIRWQLRFWMLNEALRLLFGSKLGFSRILDSLYGAFWQCSRVRLELCRKWTDLVLYLDEICSTLTLSTLSGLALADFGCDPRSSKSWRARRDFIYCQVIKQRTISPISRRPNFTKSKYNVDRCRDENFRTEFWKFYCKGSFFKGKNFSKFLNFLWFQATITPQWLQIAGNSLPK